MNELHVGGGTTRGALTVFPIWGEHTDGVKFSTDLSGLVVGERAGGASVGCLEVTNSTGIDVVVFEGQVLEGGWQNRMVARTTLVPAASTREVEVVCVEEGRWAGARDHRASGRRGSARVRSGLHKTNRQGAVWTKVREYEVQRGMTQTTSLMAHMDRDAGAVESLAAGFRTLPGQIGVVVAIAGQPVFAEVFANDDLLRREFDSIIRAAALDALGQTQVETPSRRARRFVDRALQVPRSAVPAGERGRSVTGRSEYAELSEFDWDGVLLHLVASNPRHALNLVSA